MKLLNKTIISLIIIALFVIGKPALAREGALPLASFEDALRDFREAKQNFLEIRKPPALTASPVPAPRSLEIQEPLRFEAPAIIRPQVVPTIEPERLKLLEKMTDVLIERNQSLEEKISGQDIYRAQEAEILSRVAEDLRKLKQLKTEVSRVKTESEIEAAAEKIRVQRAPQKQLQIKKSVVLPHLLKFEDQALKAAQIRKEKMLEKIMTLQATGKDVGQLKNLLNKAEVKIAAAKTKIEKIKTEVDKPNLKTDLEAVQNQLKESYQIFRNIAILGQSL